MAKRLRDPALCVTSRGEALPRGMGREIGKTIFLRDRDAKSKVKAELAKRR